MERFILFGFDNYEARGGEGDVIKSFKTLEEALEFIASVNSKDVDNMSLCDYYHVLDCDNREFVEVVRRLYGRYDERV